MLSTIWGKHGDTMSPERGRVSEQGYLRPEGGVSLAKSEKEHSF